MNDTITNMPDLLLGQTQGINIPNEKDGSTSRFSKHSVRSIFNKLFENNDIET